MLQTFYYCHSLCYGPSYYNMHKRNNDPAFLQYAALRNGHFQRRPNFKDKISQNHPEQLCLLVKPYFFMDEIQ